MNENRIRHATLHAWVYPSAEYIMHRRIVYLLKMASKTDWVS